MKCICWNVRGITNSPTKLALKKLAVKYKPIFVLVSEPWMVFSSLPHNYLERLNLKVFTVNSRVGPEPNLWCFYDNGIDREVLDSEGQYVAFSLKVMGVIFGVVAIYNSTKHVLRICL